MDKINFIAIDESNTDKITFVPIRIEFVQSKIKFLVYGNVPVILFITSIIILSYVIVFIYFNYLNGLSVLLSSSLLALLLYFLRESNKSRKKEKIYFHAFMNELERNMIMIYSNFGKLNEENKKLNENKLNIFDIEPYYQIQFDTWNYLKRDMYLDFLKFDIRKFDGLVFESNRVNQMIKARDNILKSPLINVKCPNGEHLEVFNNIFLIKKQYNEMLLKQYKLIIEYLESTLKSSGKLIKLDYKSHKHYKSFDDAVNSNKIILDPYQIREFEIIYSDKNQQLIFYQYHI